MSWQDVYVNRKLQHSEIIQALSQLFHVEPNTVAVQSEKVDLSNTEGLRVVCGTYRLRGDFPTLLEIVPLEADLIPKNHYEAVGFLCEMLNVQALIPYEMDTNPYTSTLVRKRRDYQKVKLDPDKLDAADGEQMVIAEYLEKFDA